MYQNGSDIMAIESQIKNWLKAEYPEQYCYCSRTLNYRFDGSTETIPRSLEKEFLDFLAKMDSHNIEYMKII